MDTLTPQERSKQMALVRAKNTKPELVVRRLTHRLGYRYRLHRRDLPGTPDLVFASKRKVIFVHGCFWHRHVGCSLARIPKSRSEFWLAKLTANAQRDIEHQVALSALGWSILTIWECELRDIALVEARIVSFLGG